MGLRSAALKTQSPVETHAPLGPSRFRTWTAVLPFSLFSTDTTESAGWDTIAQNTPAVGTQQSSHSLSKLQIQLRNKAFKISSQRCDTLTDVTGNEGDHQLLRFAALAARFGHHVLVEHLHSSLKAGELHHGVRDLPHPQGHHTLIEPRADHKTPRF